jgi:O-antigen ligase
VALLYAAVALIQFFWAMGSVYILKKDISDPGIYIFISSSFFNLNSLREFCWRMGIFRTPYAFTVGLYGLLILTVYLYTVKRVNVAIFTSLFSGIVISVTRMAYGGLIFVVLLQIIKKGRWIALLLLIFICTSIYYGIINENIDLLKTAELFGNYVTGNIDGSDIRSYSRSHALKIWKDHPFWGIGPGMFGGIVASRYRSYIFEEYNILSTYIQNIGSIEQFWFQILAEMGIVGTLCFINLIFTLFLLLHITRRLRVPEELKNLFFALMVFLICILIYSIGGSINLTYVLFTYNAFVGIALGCVYNQSIK